MTDRAQALLREVLTLPINERADVAAELLASLDDAEADSPAEVEAAWAAEIERRARRVLAGQSDGVAWDEVRRRAEAELRTAAPLFLQRSNDRFSRGARRSRLAAAGCKRC